MPQPQTRVERATVLIAQLSALAVVISVTIMIVVLAWRIIL